MSLDQELQDIRFKVREQLAGANMEDKINQKKSFLDKNNHIHKNYNIFDGPQNFKNEYSPMDNVVYKPDQFGPPSD